MITNLIIDGVTEDSVSEYNTLTSIKDELDLGTILIPFSTRATRYQPFDLVDVEINGGHEYWYVDYDISTPVDKEELIYYEHKIQLIELTKALERYPMPDRAYVQLSTGTKLTALDVVNDLIETVPFRKASEITSGKVIDSIDSTLSTLLQSVIVPDLFFTGRTLKEALEDLFKIRQINAYPRLTRDISGNIILTADFYNNLVTLIDKDANSYFSQQSQQSNKYAQALVTSTRNQSFGYEKLKTAIIAPHPNEFLNARSDTKLVQVNSAFIELDDKIEEIIKVEADITYEAFNIPLTTETFDITSRVLEKEVRGNLQPISPDGVEIAQENTIEYEIGGTRLTDLFEIVEDGGTVQNIELLYAAIVEESGKTLVVIDTSKINPRDIRIRVHFTKLSDSRQEISRLDLTEVKNASKLILGQNDAFIDSSKAYDSAFDRANRSGSVEYVSKEIITDLNNIHAIGSFTEDGLVITDVERVTYVEHTEVLYSWTRDLQKVSDFIGLNSEPKIFEVQTTLDRIEYFKEYVVIDTQSVPDTSYMNDFGIRVFANTISNNPSVTYDKPIHAVAFQSPEIPGQIIGGKAIHRGIIKHAGGNTIVLGFDFNHFKNAGKQQVQDGISFYNKNVVYTDDDARLTDIQYRFMNEFTLVQNDMPVIDNPTSNIHLSTGFLRLNKNQAEVTKQRHQIDIMPSQSNIRKFVVGESFVKGNNLINLFNGSFPNLVVYTTDERYNSINNAKVKGSDIVSNGYTMNIILDGATAIGFEVELTNPIGTTQNPLNWAIGDTQGNLYLGVNQIDYDDTFNNVNKAVFNFVEEAY